MLFSHIVSGKQKQRLMKLRLRKGIVKEQINKFEYLVEDVFNKEIIRMSLSGKLIMNYLILNIGDEVYVIVSLFETNRGRLANGTTFKENNDLFRQKLELERRYENMK